jgi:hypothetical protein
VPPTKCFLYLNPVQVHFDLDSCLWFFSFGLGLHESLMRTSVADQMNKNSPSSSDEPSLIYMDVKMEAIMPRVIFEAGPDLPSQRDRPKIMQIQVSRLAITNIREMGASRADLAQAIHSLQEGSLVFSSGFPSKPDDLCIVTDRILSHVAATDLTSTQPSTPNSYTSSNNLSRYALWTEPRDVWCIKLDPVWIDFIGARSIGANRAIQFVDAVPITLWIHGKSLIDDHIAEKVEEKKQKQEYRNSIASDIQPKIINDRQSLVLSVTSLNSIAIDASNGQPKTYLFDGYSSVQYSKDDYYEDQNRNEKPKVPPKEVQKEDENSADLHVIAHVANLVSVQIDHYQFLFLMRLAEELTELSTFITLDSKRILQENDKEHSIIIGCVVPQVEVTLVMPSQTPGKESSGGDAESVLPDSASLAEELHNNPSWPPGSLSDQKTANQFSSIDSPSPIKTEKFDYPIEVKSNIKFNIPLTTDAPMGSHQPHQSTLPPILLNDPLIGGKTGSSSSSSSTSTVKNKSRPSITDTVFTKELNSGLSQMKKGFSNFMTSIDSALKTNPSFDDGSDTISIQSDLSDDSEFLTVLADTDKATTDCNDFMFKLNPFSSDNNNKLAPVEVASEVCEDPYLTNMSSPSEPSESDCFRRRDLVSMATFR